MSKASSNRVSVERWTVSNTGKGRVASIASPKREVTKVAVRNVRGQFHGATNFKGSVL